MTFCCTILYPGMPAHLVDLTTYGKTPVPSENRSRIDCAPNYFKNPFGPFPETQLFRLPPSVPFSPAALHSLAQPCRALQSLAEPCRALQSLAEPCRALQSLAEPCRACPGAALQTEFMLGFSGAPRAGGRKARGILPRVKPQRRSMNETYKKNTTRHHQ